MKKGAYPRGGPATEESMRQLRILIRSSLKGATMAEASRLAQCSENTLCRILRGENVNVRTVARICEALGYRLHITAIEIQ